ncbi:MAG TPA: prepilin peptidase [Mycobacterium sp.]|nr:prepilin peptidase [Mycobacterium sp.]
MAEFAIILAALTGVVGLLIGSFLNVVVYRVPNGMSIVSPPSACPNCGRHIRGFDNVPVLSWLFLRGKCRDCREPISWRYPAVELGTAVLFLAVAWRFLPAALAGGTSTLVSSSPALIAFVFLAAISIALALIDLDVHRLPNSIVLPALIVAAVLITLAGVLTGDYDALLRAGIGMVAMFAFYFLLAVIYPGGMGFGDVKLAAVLGVYLGWLGWGELVVGAFAAFLLGGLFAIGLMIFRKAGRKSGIPFGPWMLGGAWIAILFGHSISAGYLALFGLS